MLKRHGCACPCPSRPSATHGRALHEQQQPLWSCAKRESEKQEKLEPLSKDSVTLHLRAPVCFSRCMGPRIIGSACFHAGTFLETPASAFETAMRVNYLGAVHTLKAVLPGMVEQCGTTPLTQPELAMGFFWSWTRAHGFGELAWAAQEGPRWQETTAGLKCCTTYDLSVDHKGHANAACEHASRQGHQV